MRHRVFPILAPLAKPRQNHDGHYETTARGLAILNSPQLNKGTAFTDLERRTLGLTGLLPPEISSLDTQVKRAYVQYERLPDAVGKNVYLTALHDRNEVLFYRLFSEHLREMIPIVNAVMLSAPMSRVGSHRVPVSGNAAVAAGGALRWVGNQGEADMVAVDDGSRSRMIGAEAVAETGDLDVRRRNHQVNTILVGRESPDNGMRHDRWNILAAERTALRVVIEID